MQTTTDASFGMSTAAMANKRRMRRLTDSVARVSISAGGVSVIVTICLIFFYLLYEVAPLFMPADLDDRQQYASPALAPVKFSYLEEQGRVGMIVQADGLARFFDGKSGATLSEQRLLDTPISLVSADDLASHKLALVGENGQVLIAKHDYHTEYNPDGPSAITPEWKFPLGETPIDLGKGPLAALAFRDTDSEIMLVAVSKEGQAVVKRYNRVQSFFTGEMELQEGQVVELPQPSAPVDQAFLSSDGRWLFLLENHVQIEIIDLKAASSSGMRHSVVSVLHDGATKITAAAQLLGGHSLLLGDDIGRVTQWFLVNNVEHNRPELTLIRNFEVSDDAVTALQSEQRRKSFVAGTADGVVSLQHTTAAREVYAEKMGDAPVDWLVMAPRGNALMVAMGPKVSSFKVDNEHPEVSFSSLWNDVWYERYDEPGYTWQSSSASNDFEPKFSLMPLTFGTLKASLYAMLLAVPLAIFGAIYTAYFMAPALRTKVKPAIELMGALPTVILGFLAGLWLAPIVETFLPGIFAICVITPLAAMAASWLWSLIPLDYRSRIPDGWVPLLLIPVVLLSGYVSFALSVPIEDQWFNGDMRGWLEGNGIDFDQRNALIVGIAMGFAVIPIVFSIAEDAIFAVPKALSFGSLALGATPWQTLVRVVLPTASPGIFSGLMIGLGRAVGETMIVLMAAGNTPIMDLNIFEGLRTLSANVAVEMPEAEVNSTHFRILFLSGLVLFVVTFILNTTAELVRQRLRAKYSTL